MSDPLHDYFAQAFFDDLAASTATRRSPSAQVAELWGVEPAGEFVRLIDYLGTQPAHASPELGEFLAFAAADFVPHAPNALNYLLAQPFRITALFTGTVALGCTGSGDTWLVEAAAPHRVYLHDHDSGEVEPVADGLTSFAYLGQLLERHSTAANDWAPLIGRVRGCRDVAVPDALTTWASDGVIEARHRSARDLTAALEHGPRFEVAEVAIDRSSTPGLVAGALRLFVREDTALTPLLTELSTHRSRLAKDTATALLRRTGHRGYEARLLSLGFSTRPG